MGRYTKNDLVADVKNLQATTEFITSENFYELIVRFFALTSKLHDHVEEIKKLPLKGKIFLGIKSKKMKKAEKQKISFISTIEKFGRDWRGNRTKKGQAVTRDKIYLDAGLYYLPISILEIDTEYKEYVPVENYINDLKNLNINTDWLA